MGRGQGVTCGRGSTHGRGGCGPSLGSGGFGRSSHGHGRGEDMSSSRSTVREITLLLNIGTSSMSPTSQVRNFLLPLPPQAPTRLILTGTWIHEARITLPMS
jgi:hypothetical protein